MGQLGGFAAVGLASSSEKPIHQRSSSHYGAAVAAGAGAGELKLNCTGGGFSAPRFAVKNGFRVKPSPPVMQISGEYCSSSLLSGHRVMMLTVSTEIRFVVSLICAVG